jgi:hypothetical protein
MAPLKNEIISVPGSGQAVKKALDNPPAEEKLEIITASARERGVLPGVMRRYSGFSSYRRLQVWPYHISYPADLSEIMDLIDRRLPRSQSIAESFDGNIDSDLVPVFEAVRYRFRWGIDSDRNTFQLPRVDSFGERATREPYDTQDRRLNRWLARFEIDRHPDLMGILRRQPMEAQR